MTITLKPEQEQLLYDKVKAGKDKTIEDAIAEALRLLDEFLSSRNAIAIDER